MQKTDSPHLPRLPAHVSDIVAKRLRQRETPAIAPKLILRSPIWSEPQLACRRATLKRTWEEWDNDRLCRWTAETINVLPREKDPPAPSWGLLRYQDLDIAMICAEIFVSKGSRLIEIGQADLLRRLGYERLDQAPYDELHACFRRLTNTKITIFAEGTPYSEINTWQILDDVHWAEAANIGRSTKIETNLSRIWEDVLTNGGWQAININAYTHLLRNARQYGMARVLYLFFSSWQDRSGVFDVPVYWIFERFAQRLSDHHYRYADPLNHPDSLLGKAIRILEKHRVIGFTGSINGAALHDARFQGRVLSVEAPSIALQTQQRVIFQPTLWPTGGFTNEDGHSIPTLTTVSHVDEAVNPTSQPAETPRSDDIYCEQTIPILCEQFCPKIKEREIDRARDQGWTVRELWCLLALVLWKHETTGEIKTPTNYVRIILKNGRDDPDYRTEFRPKDISAITDVSFQEIRDWVLRNMLRGFPPPGSQPQTLLPQKS